MPFKVTDNQTGKIITFENHPTDSDMNEAFGIAREATTMPVVQEQPLKMETVTPEVQPIKKQTSIDSTIEPLNPEDLKMAQGKIKEMISNIPESTINLVKNTASSFIHPIQTGKGLLKLATLDNTAWTQIANFYKERYGGFKELENTIIKDPVGFATDVSTMLSVVGGVTKLTGKTGISTLQKAGQTLSEAGKIVDPFKAIGKTITWTGQKASDVASNILGMTTGTGKTAIKQAFKGGEEFTKGLRGKIDAQMVLDNALEALNEVKQQRRTTYQTQLADIKSKTNVVIDKKPIFNQLKTSLKSFNIETYLDDAGELIVDTSKSALDKSARGAIADLVKDVLKWDDWSPQGADILKQRIDDFYAPTKNSRALVSPLRNTVKQAIIKQVPEYSKMLKDYEIMSGHIDDITKNLLSGKRDTALRRMNTVFRDVNEYRQVVLGKLDTLTDGKLTEQLAGATLNAALPRGWPSKVVPSVGAGAMAFYNPAVAAGILASSSPRLMGEIALKTGQVGRGVEQVGKALMPHWKYLYQAGRTRGLLENKEK